MASHYCYALYRHFDSGGKLLYVGISLRMIRRLVEHRDRSEWYQSIAKITVEWFPSRQAAYEAETVAIRDEAPSFNISKTGNKRRVEQKKSFKSKRPTIDGYRRLRRVKLDGGIKRIDVMASEIGELPCQILDYIRCGFIRAESIECHRSLPEIVVSGNEWSAYLARRNKNLATQ